MSTNIRVTRICEYCKNEFVAKTTRTRYCSHTCNSRAYKAGKRVEKVEAVRVGPIRPKVVSTKELKSKDYLSITEACALTGVSRWTLWRAIDRGELNAASIGRRRLIRRSDIEELFDSNPVQITTIIEQVKKTLPKEKKEFNVMLFYSMNEIIDKYKVSPKGLYELLERIGIEKIKKGKYTYVPKEKIDAIFNLTQG